MPRRSLAVAVTVALAIFSGWHFGLSRQSPLTLWAPLAVDPLDVYLELDKHLVTIDAKDMPLKDFLADLSRQSGVPIELLDDLGLAIGTDPVTARAQDESLRSVLLRVGMWKDLWVSVAEGTVVICTSQVDAHRVSRAYRQSDFPFQQAPENLFTAIIQDDLLNLASGGDFGVLTSSTHAAPGALLASGPLEAHLALQRVQRLLCAPDAVATHRRDLPWMVPLTRWASPDFLSHWCEDPIEFSGETLLLDQVFDVVEEQSVVALDRSLPDFDRQVELTGKASGAEWLDAVLLEDEGWTLLGKTVVIAKSYALPKEVRAYRLPEVWADFVLTDITRFIEEAIESSRWTLQGGDNDMSVLGGWLIVRATTDVHLRLMQQWELLSRDNLDSSLHFPPLVAATRDKLREANGWEYDQVPRSRLSKDLASIGVPSAILIERIEDFGGEVPKTLTWPGSTSPLWARLEKILPGNAAKSGGQDPPSPMDWRVAIANGGILVFAARDDDVYKTTAMTLSPLRFKSSEELMDMLSVIGDGDYWDQASLLGDRAAISGSLKSLMHADHVLQQLAETVATDRPYLKWVSKPEDFGRPSSEGADSEGTFDYVAVFGVADLARHVPVDSIPRVIWEAGIPIEGESCRDMLVCKGSLANIHHAIMLLIQLRRAMEDPDDAFPVQLLLPMEGHDAPLSYESLSDWLEQSEQREVVSSIQRRCSAGEMLGRLSQVLGAPVHADGDIESAVEVFGHLILNVPRYRVAGVAVAGSEVWPDPFGSISGAMWPLVKGPHRRIVLQRPPPLPDISAIHQWEEDQPLGETWQGLLDKGPWIGPGFRTSFMPTRRWPAAPWVEAINVAGRQNVKNTAVQRFLNMNIVTGDRHQLDLALEALAVLHGSPQRLSQLPGWEEQITGPLEAMSAAEAIRDLAARHQTPIIVQNADAAWGQQVTVDGRQSIGDALQSIAEKLGQTFERRGNEAWLVDVQARYGTEVVDASQAMEAIGWGLTDLATVERMLQAAVSANGWLSLKQPPSSPFTPVAPPPQLHLGCTLPLSKTQLMVVHKATVRRQVKDCLAVVALHPKLEEADRIQWLGGSIEVKRGLALWRESRHPDPSPAVQDAVNQLLRSVDPDKVDHDLSRQVISTMLAWKKPRPDLDHCRKLLDALPPSHSTTQQLIVVLLKTREGGEALGKRLVQKGTSDEQSTAILAEMASEQEGFRGALPFLLQMGLTKPNILMRHTNITLGLPVHSQEISKILKQWSNGVGAQQEKARGARAFLNQIGVNGL